jgi:FYVE-type zinc finger protein
MDQHQQQSQRPTPVQSQPSYPTYTLPTTGSAPLSRHTGAAINSSLSNLSYLPNPLPYPPSQGRQTHHHHHHLSSSALPSTVGSAQSSQAESLVDFLRENPNPLSPSSIYHHQPTAARHRALADRKRRFSALTSSPESASSSRPTPPFLNPALLHGQRLRHIQQIHGYRSQMAGRPHASSLPGTSSVVPSGSIVIDLTGDDEENSNVQSTRTRATSNTAQPPFVYNLPPWQPDSDVTFCPFCRREFTFFYRKHHCR